MSEIKKEKIGLTTYKHPDLTWVNVTNATPESMAVLREQFPFFMDIDLRDCLPPYQRPKLLERDRYLFMVLQFPVFDHKNRIIESSELDLFIGKDFVVTSHNGKVRALADMAASFESGANICPLETVNCPANWLHTLLASLYISVFPMLTHISNDIGALEAELFRDTNGDTVKDILRVKSNIVDFRKIMQGHKHVIEKFMRSAPKMLNMKDLEVYYEDLVGHTKEIWDFLDNDKNTIDAVYDSYLSLITYQASEASKTLTALAFIIFPMNLVAAIFTMRAVHMPIEGLPGDFWFMLGIVGLTAVVTIGFLRRKKWL